MARIIRKDITVKGLEKKLGVAPGTIKNADGRDALSDKKLETLQREAARALIKSVTKKTSSRVVDISAILLMRTMPKIKNC